MDNISSRYPDDQQGPKQGETRGKTDTASSLKRPRKFRYTQPESAATPVQEPRGFQAHQATTPTHANFVPADGAGGQVDFLPQFPYRPEPPIQEFKQARITHHLHDSAVPTQAVVPPEQKQPWGHQICPLRI
ncbi:hypothetical protein [Dictyobacter vulcani]|uniref:hypothetical protein n=1 Tax=Dictyobacter vulcani TaxID=2607529 RepID=UPI00124FF00D|nr:hypothetical protein [Dictyobacter vulcani]